MVLLAIAVICGFAVNLVFKKQEAQKETEQLQKSTKIDVLKQRIDVLNDLKNQGILTDAEYEQKRSEIINELKI